ncbi:hypothetical protein HMPREF9623_01810 [Stomatobaculum longum]|jgi:hypothetical protein|uniref:Uncharacterized protein n=1 Tax=Stomatobaculum longum TaxID=796942 RepID=A0AA36Y3N9_9FIRM|nr:hypothetical protein [Stomatobaculum longum]EHO15899.1 hypothetical protein HMPREF9623_01810 [Stomatobaculum longum]
MSVTSFLHLRETGGEFDIRTFGEEIAKIYPGTETEQRQGESVAYDIAWSRYANRFRFELRLDRTRRTLAVEYFDSEHRIRDYANFILWIRRYFPRDEEVILVDETNAETMLLSPGAATDDIEAWLLRVGV